MSEDMSVEQVEYKYKCAKCGHEWTQVMQKHMGSSIECQMWSLQPSTSETLLIRKGVYILQRLIP